jgi:hypothetical protein
MHRRIMIRDLTQHSRCYTSLERIECDLDGLKLRIQHQVNFGELLLVGQDTRTRL